MANSGYRVMDSDMHVVEPRRVEAALRGHEAGVELAHEIEQLVKGRARRVRPIRPSVVQSLFGHGTLLRLSGAARLDSTR